MAMSSPRKALVEVEFFFKFLGLDIEVDIIGQSLRVTMSQTVVGFVFVRRVLRVLATSVGWTMTLTGGLISGSIALSSVVTR